MKRDHKAVPVPNSHRVRRGRMVATCEVCAELIYETVKRNAGSAPAFGWRHGPDAG